MLIQACTIAIAMPNVWLHISRGYGSWPMVQTWSQQRWQEDELHAQAIYLRTVASSPLITQLTRPQQLVQAHTI